MGQRRKKRQEKRVPPPDGPVVTVAVEDVPQADPPKRRVWILAAALAIACLLIYTQTLWHDFTNYDDPDYVIRNTNVNRGITVEGILWAFRSVGHYYWQPLTWISHMIDCQLFGQNPGPHHLVSALIHAANTALLFLFLWKLTGAMWPSAFAAALFGLHPLRVESVAWIAERKDVLSGFFSILTLYAYVAYTREKSRRSYLWMFAAFCAAMMSKPTTVTLPFVMLLVDWWPRGRWREAGWRQLVREKAPLFGVIAAMSVVTLIGQKLAGAVVTLKMLPVWFRTWNAALSYARYLGNLVWPVDLAIVYPYGRISALAAASAFLLLAAISLIAVWRARKNGYLFTGWFWFVGMMVPMIGLAQTGVQSRADRFTYLPMIGLSIAIAWGMTEICDRFSFPVRARAAGAAILLALLFWRSYDQTALWKDSFRLFTHALSVTKDNDLIHINLATLYERRGDIRSAIPHMKEAVRIEPNNSHAHALIGSMDLQVEDFADAIHHLQIALKINSSNSQARKHLAEAYWRSGRKEEAKSELMKVLEANPNDIEAQGRLFMLAIP
jgi:Flp pilus assembly protein TadD